MHIKYTSVQFLSLNRACKMATSRSKVWDHFNEPINGSASCKICSKSVRCAGSSTSGLRKQLINVHKIVLAPISTSSTVIIESVDSPPEQHASKKQKRNPKPRITDFVKKAAMPEIVSKLIALDDISAHTIVNSEFIRKSFFDKNMKLPKQHSAVMDLMHQFYETAKQNTIVELNKLKVKGEKFSVTLDEWTSGASHRYLNVNVHTTGGLAYNFVLIRIV